MGKLGDFVEIEPDFLRKLSEGRGNANTTYFDVRVVRWLYWNRLRQLLNVASVFPAERVLDLGCGEGVFLPTLSRAYKRVYGLDLDVNAAKKVVDFFGLQNVELRQENVLGNDFDDGFFDIIFAASVLEHFKDLKPVFDDISRMLKEGGLLVFSSPTESWLYELGRKIFGYRKPSDHFHSVFEIAEFASDRMDFVGAQSGPFRFLPSKLAAYRVYVFRK